VSPSTMPTLGHLKGMAHCTVPYSYLKRIERISCYQEVYVWEFDNRIFSLCVNFIG
jgi:hypothetical protein